MAPGAPEIADGTVLVEDDEIVAVGPRGAVEVPATAEVIDARGCAVLPGFVNAHTHVPQILLRGGASSNRDLFDWLMTALRPGLDGFTSADIRSAYRLYCLEALRAGVTTIIANDHVGPMDHVAAAAPAIDALDESGIRATYARMFADQRPPGSIVLLDAVRARRPAVRHVAVERPTDAILADLDRVVAAHHGRGGGRIRVCPSPNTAETVSLDALRHCQRVARERTGLWALHVQETVGERPHPALSAIDLLGSHGLLDKRLLAGHCVHADRRDLRLLRRHDVAVSTQPVSNGVLASGIAPVPEMLDMGLRVGLGTDDASCNDAVNPLADVKTLCVVQRASRRDVSAMTAAEALGMATIGGARAVGLGAVTGSLEVGKQADVVVLDLGQPHLVPAHDLIETLVWQANGSEVRDVLVAGRVVLRERRATYLDPAAQTALLAEAAERSDRLVRRAGIHPCPH